jgi:NAD(P)-dependent dehydrogenase (short-subunit alcohol dehydrogenase family)
MTGRVKGKVAIITGGASGIGAACARVLAAEGAAVVIADLSEEAGETLCGEIVGIGGQAMFLRLDVASEADWQSAVAETIKRFARLDILVNNAGVAGGQDLMTHSLEDWRRVLSVNLDGVFLGLRHAGPAMGPGASVINVSSILGKVGLANAAAYCASKGGVLMLTKAAALEWAPLGIRVNSVHPGFIETPMLAEGVRQSPNGNEMREMLISRHPLGRLGLSAEVAAAVLFLASDESSFMTGAEMLVDGGYTAQ